MIVARSTDRQNPLTHRLPIEPATRALVPVPGPGNQMMPCEQHALSTAQLTRARFVILNLILQACRSTTRGYLL